MRFPIDFFRRLFGFIAVSFAVSVAPTAILTAAAGQEPTAATESAASASVSADKTREETTDGATEGSGTPDEASSGKAGPTPMSKAEFEALQKDPVYLAEVEKRRAKFSEAKQALVEALSRQRAAFMRYVNLEDRTPAGRKQYFDARADVCRLMDETYMAALEVIRVSGDEETATYLVTMIDHRLKRDIYDIHTLEGATRMIDGGSLLASLFEASVRSAVSEGEFDMAKQLFDALDRDKLKDVDKSLYFLLDLHKERYEAEEIVRAKEAEEDRLPRVKLETTQGDVILELFIDQAPSTVSNFIQLVEQGFYDGLDFYQVIDHLFALTGDPTGLGDGNSSKFVVDEHERADHRHAFRGSLLMAKIPVGDTGEFVPNTGSSQFAILFLPVAQASDNQTVFGRVIEGMDVVSRMRRIDPSKEKKKDAIQIPPDRIIEATVIRRPAELPEPVYVRPGMPRR
ncbi:putative peptidyl-prolyl cis-trans isomerase [Rubripirellula tenax]|uniref:peptidylprolyl isomerase n=1 Tax=Rubripirellula tenax TaxID=2528015 RepID=A0A5C6EK86_9BACT|nr:peptidylprolyl isomerase [Rubripirellula tenax]TWU48855.1 putative peptidyl-prolyl cis-trans isomerase [Rubripirellula tenax]